MDIFEADRLFMKQALEEAQHAALLGEVPIGAVLVYQGKIIARAHNLRETTQNATTHAELLVIQEACKNRKLATGRYYSLCYIGALSNVCRSHSPITCAPGCLWCKRSKAGCVDSLYHLLNDERFNHECDVTEGILAEECGQILTDFFKALRDRKKAEKKHD